MSFLNNPDAQLRVAEKPRVYLIGQNSINQAAVTQYLQDEMEQGTVMAVEGTPSGWQQQVRDVRPTGAESLVEFAGRLCYNSFGVNQGRSYTEDYLQNILEMGHGSVLEHASFTFLMADVSRGLTHELVRHRPFAISQQSSRYVVPSMEAVYPPQLVGHSAETRHEWELAIRRAFLSQAELADLYADRLHGLALTRDEQRAERKAAREVGRSAMPTAAVTRIVVTGNAREWRWFLQLRGNPGAEPEIRRLTTFLLPLLKNAAPFLFADMRIALQHDSQPGISYAYWKV